MTHMTNADYQKRLEYLLTKAFDTGYEASRTVKGPADDHYITHQEVMVAEASKALTALCRDVCGEVVGSAAIGDYAQAQQSNAVTAILGQPQEQE